MARDAALRAQRNRQSAARSRQRTLNLIAKLTSENETLTLEIAALKATIAALMVELPAPDADAVS